MTDSAKNVNEKREVFVKFNRGILYDLASELDALSFKLLMLLVAKAEYNDRSNGSGRGTIIADDRTSLVASLYPRSSERNLRTLRERLKRLEDQGYIKVESKRRLKLVILGYDEIISQGRETSVARTRNVSGRDAKRQWHIKNDCK
ncbi:MAG: hypothetical protein P8L85_07955 [Rubripirellula sp.]|nr:hypothetical protein [Rubripirellula sp.]